MVPFATLDVSKYQTGNQSEKLWAIYNVRNLIPAIFGPI